MTSASQSVDLMTTVLNAYSLEATDAAYVSDVLFKTIKMGKTTGPELALSFGRVASMAAAAAIPLEDMAAATVALTRAGLKTDEAMTALRQVINKIVNPTEAAQKAVERLGLTMFSEETLKQEGGLIKILAELAEKAKYTSKDLKMFFEIIRNIRAVTGLAALSRQLEDLPIKTTKSLIDFVAEKGYSQEYGARNIARFIKNNVSDKIADAILNRLVPKKEEEYYTPRIIQGEVKIVDTKKFNVSSN